MAGMLRGIKQKAIHYLCGKFPVNYNNNSHRLFIFTSLMPLGCFVISGFNFLSDSLFTRLDFPPYAANNHLISSFHIFFDHCRSLILQRSNQRNHKLHREIK